MLPDSDEPAPIASLCAGMTNTDAATIKPVSVDDILAQFRAFEDKMLDEDVRLLEALRSLGARITIEDRGYFSADGPILIVMPPRYKRAEAEIERRKRLREQAADHAAKYAWPSVLLPGGNRILDMDCRS